MTSVAIQLPTTAASLTAENREQPDTIFSSEASPDKIEVLQRSASMDITYALYQERSKKASKGRASGRSRSSHVAGRRRPSSPLARALTKRTPDDDDDDVDYDHELRALNRRWQANLLEDVEKLRSIKTKKTSSNVTNQDDETIQVKNSAVNYRPSAQKKQQQEKDDQKSVEETTDEVEIDDLKLKLDDFKLKLDDDPPSTDNSTSSSVSADNPFSGQKPPKSSTKRNRFFNLLSRKKAEEEKRFAEIVMHDRYADNSSVTASGFFSNKKHPSHSNSSSGKRKHFSLTPFPTPPRAVQTVPQPTPKAVVMKRDAVSDLSSVTASTLTTTSKTSTSLTTRTESTADEILRDLSLSSSASTSSSHGPTPTTASVAPTKEQIAAAIANPEKSLKRARRYRKEATRLLHSVVPDKQNVFTSCAPQENPREFRGRAKKAYQYAAEARRLYDLLEKVEADVEEPSLSKANDVTPKARKESREGTSSAQSCSSEDTHTDSTTFSEKLAREELQNKMKELALFSEFDITTGPKLPIACNNQNTEDHLGSIYAAEAHRIMRTFSEEHVEDIVAYASPVPSYEEMSVMTSVTEKHLRDEHKARMAELQLFTTETITSSLHNSFKRAVESMRQQQVENQKKIFDLFRSVNNQNQQSLLDVAQKQQAEVADEEESVTSAHPGFRGYNTGCRLAVEDDATDASGSTAGQTTVKSGKETVVSDDASSDNESHPSLYTVNEDEVSSEDESNAESADSAQYDTESGDDDDDESAASESSHSTDGSRSDQSSRASAKTSESESVKGVGGWIRGF